MGGNQEPGQHPFYGRHVLAELYGVERALLDDPGLLSGALTRGIEASGATLCGFQVKQFPPTGLTLLALLAESHASIHTYPEEGALFFDAFTCGTRCRPEGILETLIETLRPLRHTRQTVTRGLPGGSDGSRSSSHSSGRQAAKLSQ